MVSSVKVRCATSSVQEGRGILARPLLGLILFLITARLLSANQLTAVFVWLQMCIPIYTEESGTRNWRTVDYYLLCVHFQLGRNIFWCH